MGSGNSALLCEFKFPILGQFLDTYTDCTGTQHRCMWLEKISKCLNKTLAKNNT